MTYRIGSLCSGYGGLDMAVQDVLGGSVAWHCQYDPDDRHQYAALILDHHWPDVPNHGDITAVDWSQVEPVDVLTAGFPCQDLSYAGRGAGIKEGTRSGLWYSVARAIGALRPGLVFLENVRAIVARRPGLDAVLASLAELGFDAEWESVRASDVGAPHERWRWFLLAWPAETGRPGWEGHRLQGAAPERGGAAADTDDQRGHRGRACGAGRDEPTAHHLAVADSHGDAPGDDRELPARRHAVQRRLRDDTPGRRPSAADSHRSGLGADQPHARAGQPDFDWRGYGPAIQRWERILGRPAPSPVDDRRRLAAPFVEWMMGLPEGHVCEVPAPDGMTAAGLRNARLKALGNGVVPAQAAHALRLLLNRAGREVAA